VTLNSVGLITTGDYAEDLQELAASGAGGFLGVCVVAPALFGILMRAALGERRAARVRPCLKLANSLVLLVLMYSNAAAALPEAVLQPDADFLALMLAVVLALCLVAFASGWLLARLLKADPAQQTALMFGLGMNNNGTGLVLASVALAGHPAVLLPIILYNLVQHIVAGMIDFVLCRRPAYQEC
jgi:BASS family bile acid:Na+ symporter